MRCGQRIAHLKVQEAGGAKREKLGAILNRLGMVSARDVAEGLATQRGWTIVEATEFPELPILEETVSPRFLQDAQSHSRG